MPRPDFSDLKKDLLQMGIAPRHAYRTISELGDHFDDLVDAELADGCVRVVAEQHALCTLGDFQAVVLAMQQQPRFRSWAWRWPRLALLVYPLACVAALPAVPLVAGVQNASILARWLTCLLLGGLVTAAMFLLLQLSITHS